MKANLFQNGLSRILVTDIKGNDLIVKTWIPNQKPVHGILPKKQVQFLKQIV